MKVSRLLIVACCATETESAFVRSSSARSRRRAGHLSAVDSSLMDPYSNPAIFLAGAGATFAAAIAAYQKNKIDGSTTSNASGGKRRAESGPPKADLSIPYDAAAIAAYDAIAAEMSSSSSSSSSSTTTTKDEKKVDFETFRALYEARTVAEVKAKARLRILNEDVEALKARLAAVEGEIAGKTGDVKALNDEAEDFGVRIRELFR